jgi:hypothetical protein
MTRYLGDKMLTVTVTCKVWPDKDHEMPFVEALHDAVDEVIDLPRGERFVIDVYDHASAPPSESGGAS